MKKKAMVVFLFSISVFALIALSCNVVSSAGELKETGEALATSVESGREILGTGQAIVTQIDESGIKETMQAVATDIGESGVKETVQSFATEVGESGIKETAQAVVTDLPSLSGEKPADIPVLGDGVNDLIASQDFVSYFSVGTFQEVVDFYTLEMPVNGWSKIDRDSTEIDGLATFVYEKDGRRATVIITQIPIINQVTVAITIENP
ncbi:MAG TPA: hypothetical protein VLM80_10965 [Anaerolineales bacterium]|nr:hypothetical protein [Anaerolineales bacterium]